ncbi:MAG: NAD(P)H-binding protein, partial [Actinomycetota bacterium]
MRAFVTGATGFIGGRLARALRARGDDVVALVRSPERARELESLGVV